MKWTKHQKKDEKKGNKDGLNEFLIKLKKEWLTFKTGAFTNIFYKGIGWILDYILIIFIFERYF